MSLIKVFMRVFLVAVLSLALLASASILPSRHSSAGAGPADHVANVECLQNREGNSFLKVDIAGRTFNSIPILDMNVFETILSVIPFHLSCCNPSRGT